MLDIIRLTAQAGCSEVTSDVMNARLRRIFLILFAGVAFRAGVFAETNTAATALPPDAANGFLQIQQQLHDTQLAIEQNRRQADVEVGA